LPPVGALDQPRGDEGILERARSNPRFVVAIAAGAILLLAWIGWAVYVTSSDGATAGLGVVIAWPAMLAALALISLPFIGGYLLIRRLTPSEGDKLAATTDAADDEGESKPAEEEEPEDSADDEDAGEEDGDEESDESEDEDDASDDDSESDTEAKAAKS
jgi:hypothetical protein